MAFIIKNHPFLCVIVLVITYATLGLQANAQPKPATPATPAGAAKPAGGAAPAGAAGGAAPAGAGGGAAVPAAGAAPAGAGGGAAVPAAAGGAAVPAAGAPKEVGPIPVAPNSPAAQFCDPDGDVVFCGQIIKDAKTWEEAMTTSINAAIGKLTEGQKALDGLEGKLDAGVDPEKKKNIVNICSDGFDTVMDSLKESLTLVTNDPTLGLNNKVSAAFSGFSSCIDVLTEDPNQKTEIRELIGLNLITQQYVYISLMVANRDPRVKNYYQKLEQGVDA